MEEQMLNYIGCKVIKALPMGERAFINKIKNEDVPQNQEDRPGYLVEYPDGYKSWSPQDVFENAYRLISEKEMELIVS